MICEVRIACFLSWMDGSLGGSAEDIIRDIEVVREEGAKLGLETDWITYSRMM